MTPRPTRERVFISQPLKGRTDEQIFEKRHEIVALLINKGYVVLDPFLEEYSDLENVPPFRANDSMAYLGKSIEILASADIIFMVADWEFERRCKVEHRIAKEHGLRVAYDRPFYDPSNSRVKGYDTYIELCTKAREIQERWTPQTTDRVIICRKKDNPFLVIKQEYSTTLTHATSLLSRETLHDNGVFWLPRQEDLQKIYMEKEFEALGDMLNQFNQFHWDKEEKKQIVPTIINMESVVDMYWLVFVMETCFDKMWDGYDWVTKEWED
ncbi:MAG: DUF4406 domain-containing protein [Clostridiaceae bacterium]|nr:DUF4406 domain-containing protein [Clostridiaceae bacterium]